MAGLTDYRSTQPQFVNFASMKPEAYDMGAEWDVSWSQARTRIGLRYGLTDAHGRSKSKGDAKLMVRAAHILETELTLQ